MTEVTGVQGRTDPGAEPTERVGGWFVASLTAARVGFMAALLVPVVILAPRQVEALGEADKVANLAIVYTVGGVTGLFTVLIIAALCDRAAARFGRRQPWIVAGAILAAAGFVVQSGASSLGTIIAASQLHGLGLAAMGAALSAAIPDSVPRGQRGWVSAWVGSAESIALVAGVAATSQLTVSEGCLLLAVLVAVPSIWFVLVTPEPPGLRRQVAPWRWRAFFSRFWVSPRRHPDFAWAWLTRLTFVSSQAMATSYLVFLLQDAIGFERIFPGRSVTDGVVVLTVTVTLALLATTFAAGAVADRLGRRKPFVIVGAALFAGGALLVALLQTWPALLVASVLWGAGQGLYQAMDLAIAADVLPSAADRSRHLAVADLANSLPNSLAPALGGAVITVVGGYSGLYGLVAVGAALTAVFVLPIRSVR